MGISDQTLYRWKKQDKEAETDQFRQFKQLQKENAQLNRLVAGLSLDKTMGVLAKKVALSQCRPVVSYMHDAYRMS